MAEARQKEMKVNITVVATKTFIAGLEPSTDVAMLQKSARLQIGISLEDSTGKAASSVAEASVRDDAKSWSSIMPKLVSQRFGVVRLMLLRSEVGMGDAVMPAERVFVEENPNIPHAERYSRE